MSAAIGKAIRNSAWQSLSGLSITGLNFLQMLVIARALGPALFGSFVTSQAQVLFWMLLVDLGLTSGLIAALTEFEAGGARSSRPLVAAALLVRFAGAALGSLIVFFLAGKGDAALYWQSTAYLPYLFAWAFQQTAVSLATYRGRQGLAIAAATACSFASACLSIFLVLRGNSLSLVLFAQSLWGFLAAFWIMLGLRGPRLPDSSSQGVCALLWKNSWPYALVFAALTAWGRLDQIVTANLLGLEAGGQYGLAARLVAIPVLLAASVAFSIFPDLQRLGRDAPEKIPVYTGAVLKLMFRWGLPLSFFFLGVVAFAILPLLPKFRAGLSLLPWFALGVWAYWMHSFAINAFWGSRRYREIVLAHLYALAAYMFAIVPLVKALGNRGAALAYDLFGLVLLAAAVFYMRRLGVLARNFRFFAPLDPSEAFVLEKVKEKIQGRIRRGSAS
jgi:O-antigen/teichoic acid export membrane protein